MRIVLGPAVAGLAIIGCSSSGANVHDDAQAQAAAAAAEAAKAPPEHTEADDRRATDPSSGARSGG